MPPQWLDWAQRLQAIAQNGLTYVLSDYDRERYEQIREIANEVLAAQTGQPVSKFHEAFVMEQGYSTPKVDVRGVVAREGRILLVREREDGGWTLPGGWADIGQSAAESVVRELREESGYETRAVRLLAVFDRNKHPHPPIPFHAFKLFFHCEITGGEAAVSGETTDVGWFEADGLPPLSLTRVLPEQIALCLRMVEDRGLPVMFD
jgi:ADP-ribose pyrophosphatase YjhB (NUDIX family)